MELDLQCQQLLLHRHRQRRPLTLLIEPPPFNRMTLMLQCTNLKVISNLKTLPSSILLALTPRSCTNSHTSSSLESRLPLLDHLALARVPLFSSLRDSMTQMMVKFSLMVRTLNPSTSETLDSRSVMLDRSQFYSTRLSRRTFSWASPTPLMMRSLRP